MSKIIYLITAIGMFGLPMDHANVYLHYGPTKLIALCGTKNTQV